MREEVAQNIRSMGNGLSPKLNDLKIAELDDPELAIIYEEQEGLYLGRKNKTLYFPLLKDEVLLPSLSSVTVDTGASRFVTNGANLMRPGIVLCTGEFSKGELILVKEAGHQKSIAVGRALESKTSLEAMQKGAAVENIHYVGDKLWEAMKSLQSK